MFTKKHVEKIKKISEDYIQKMILERAEKLQSAYRENPIVKEAKVFFEGETVNIDIKLNFIPKDEEQNIPGVLEYGGVIFDTNNEMHEIEPGFYIRRIMAYGLPK